MVALRYAYLLALVFWLGGMLALGGVAAPAIFAALTGAHGMAGREMAGLAFGAVLRRFCFGASIASAVMILSLVATAIIGPRPVRFARRLALIVIMAALTVYSGFVIGPRVDAMRRAIGAPVASLADTDPRRVEFARLHRLSSALLGAAVVGGLALLVWEARAND